MSADLLQSRLTGDIQKRVDEEVTILVSQRQAPLDDMRYHQGVIAGLREAKSLLDERAKDLYKIG